MDDSKFQLKYSGSVGWLIFWAVVWFPIALLILLMNSKFQSRDLSYHLEYPGSLFWLGFWLIAFFPVTIILLVANGVTLVKGAGFEQPTIITSRS